MNGHAPTVSAVIPTRNRPQLVLRAVRSALNQTFRDLEVVVVVDGPDPATVAQLAQIDDARLRVIELPQSVGGSDARNMGVNSARGEWIACLDDDDEWLPRKILDQFDKAQTSQYKYPVITGSFIATRSMGQSLEPRRAPFKGESIADYLFAPRTIFRSEGRLSTCVVLAKRELFMRVPFTSGLRRHQDTDWYVRIGALEGVGVESVTGPLAIVYVDDNRPRIGNCNNWKYTLDWLQSVKHLMSRRAFAGFIATQLGAEAYAQHDLSAFFPLLKVMCLEGRPTLILFAHYLGTWAIPNAVRGFVRKQLRLKRGLQR